MPINPRDDRDIERPVQDDEEERHDRNRDRLRRDISSEAELPGEDSTEGPRSGI